MVEANPGIGLVKAHERGEVALRMNPFAIPRLNEPHRWVRRNAARPVSSHINQQPAGFGLAIVGHEHHHRRGVGVQFTNRQHVVQVRVDQEMQQCAVQVSAIAHLDSRLRIQRQLVGELGLIGRIVQNRGGIIVEVSN